jgi:hypothetical protein
MGLIFSLRSKIIPGGKLAIPNLPCWRKDVFSALQSSSELDFFVLKIRDLSLGNAQ